ncbi:MAG: UDP-3-O-(3-hydroxymyristoyl)glucosamine N-acyltransferase [Chromatiales bacterium]
MQIKLSDLAEQAGASWLGDGECLIHAVNTLTEACEGDITFLTNSYYRKHLATTSASAVILSTDLVDSCPLANMIVSDNPYLAFARIASLLDDSIRQSPGIHDSAVIESDASIDASASIGALVYIGPACRIGKNVVIQPGAVLQAGCVVDDETLIGANVTLCREVKIGKRCFVQAGAVIGGDGFGFAKDGNHWIKIPQSGSVIIGDDVEVGVNTAIDRGAIQDTVISNGVKLDNLIQVAHNVHIGENTAIAGQTAIAGSTTIGRNCTIGGCSGIVGHIELGDNVHVSAMTKVTKSIHEPGQYTGHIAAMPHQQWSRNMVRFRQLDELARKIQKLEKKLEDKS